jgi:hypothetical protein
MCQYARACQGQGLARRQPAQGASTDELQASTALKGLIDPLRQLFGFACDQTTNKIDTTDGQRQCDTQTLFGGLTVR